MALCAPRGVWAFDNWLTLRDAGVVRQQYDYSCGLAALATLLQLAGEPITEDELLQTLAEHFPEHDPQDGGVSMADLAWLAGVHGYPAGGFYLDEAALRELRQPVIVALSVNGRAHFSVLNSVDSQGVVHLADPSWGNRRVAAWEFSTLFVPARDGASDKSYEIPRDNLREHDGDDTSAASATTERVPATGRVLIVLGRDGNRLPRSVGGPQPRVPVQRIAPSWLGLP